MKKLINQILKFGVVGGIAFVIDYGLMVFLTEVFKVPALISAAISFTVSVIFNYIASVKWVFDVDKEKNRIYKIKNQDISYDDYINILENFKFCSDKISTRVLLQLSNHFENRSNDIPRILFSKGNVQQLTVLPKLNLEFSADVLHSIHNIIEEIFWKSAGENALYEV